MRIRWSEHARLNLLEIFRFVANDKPVAARRLVAPLRASTTVLRQHPFIGRTVPEIEVGNLRERIVPPYRIIYHVRKDEFVVLMVVRDSRDPTAILPPVPTE